MQITSFVFSVYSDCCQEKKVGDISYTLYNSKDTIKVPTKCSNSCVYNVKGQSSSKLYCFAPGKLQSECISKGINFLDDYKCWGKPFLIIFITDCLQYNTAYDLSSDNIANQTTIDFSIGLSEIFAACRGLYSF